MFKKLFTSCSPKKSVKRIPKKKIQSANVNSSIQNIRSALEKLEKREAHLEKQIAILTKTAKEKMAKKDKKGALYAMKRKKLLEKEQEGILGKKMTLEKQHLALENAQTNATVTNALREGVDAIGDIQSQTKAEDVEEMMDDLAEIQDDQDAINDAFGQAADDFDEDELLEELEGLEDDGEKELNENADRLDLPDAPNKKLSVKRDQEKSKQEEEEEMAELRQMMAE